jgi:3-isopropylmalate dehydrogenase
MYKISLITGDGIGPEIAGAVSTVLDAISGSAGPHLELIPLQAGDAALAKTGRALPPETLEAIRGSDACLKAPVGESAADVIVVLRRVLDLYANVRPARSYPGMPALRDDIDMVIVRENTEDLYVGKEFDIGGAAVALRIISEAASRRIAEFAFQAARRRNGARKVTCVHKSNVMRVTDGIFSRECSEVAKRYPEIRLEQMYVDACAMNLIRQPEAFDVIVTTNLFGDILSDESSQVVGGLGMAPAANIGDRFAIFEPVHGAAFDIAGRNIANPSSFILSAAMMLDWLAQRSGDPKCSEAARLLEGTILCMVRDGARTLDVGGKMTTTEFAQEAARRISRRA